MLYLKTVVYMPLKNTQESLIEINSSLFSLELSALTGKSITPLELLTVL